MKNDVVREHRSSPQGERGDAAALSDGIRGQKRPPHAAIAPSAPNGKVTGEPAAVASSHPEKGVPMSGTEQIGVGLLLFGSLTCMIVGSILSIAATRTRIAAAWATCFAVGCLGVVAVIVVLGKLDADRAPRERLPDPIDDSPGVARLHSAGTAVLGTDRFSLR